MTQPQQLGKYTISEVLGRGAMGVVYKGFDPDIHRTVALKTIRKDLIEDGTEGALSARFRNEARAAGRLCHPGIVSVYEYGEDGDVAFLAMEFVEGSPLREYLERGVCFDVADVVSLMSQLLDALAHAHEQGVWHRDIKPANVILNKNGRLKVADFGIARIETSDLTQAGSVMGTPGYMAPEQFQGLEVDARADIFSAGVVFYQLLSGTRPFVGTAASLGYKICHETPRPPSQVDPHRCPAPFDTVVAKALAKNPDDRYRDADAFREGILEAHAGPARTVVSDHTMLNEVPRETVCSLPTPRPGEGTFPEESPSSPGTTSPPTGWEADTLRTVREQLARHLGPVASLLVKRAASSTTDIDSLYRVLADELPSPADRSAFLAGRRQILGSGTNPPTNPAGLNPAGTNSAATSPVAPVACEGTGRDSDSPPVTPEAVETAARFLAPFLGPIAKVLAKRMAGRAENLGQFHALLAEQLPDLEERKQFLREANTPR